MRILVLISHDLYLRNFFRSGAFRDIDGPDTFYAASADLQRVEELERHGNFVGTIEDPEWRMHQYGWMRSILMAAIRRKSNTARIKTGQTELRGRWAAKFLALPGVKQVRMKMLLRKLGLNEDLQRVLREVKPDLVIAPTQGTDSLVLDAVRGCRELGIPTLLLVSGWDNLSSKLTFSILPDWLGVWGEQSIDHAVRLHNMPAERVFALGAPTFEQYFSWEREGSSAPYSKPYVLFAGCALPFDERTALQRLNDAVEEMGGGLTIVYRPHPWRIPRARPDHIEESELRHVVIDRQVREAYDLARGAAKPVGPDQVLPELDYYPSLVGNAQFVVCPLSTMTVESALLDRRVLVLAYDDHVHDVPPNVVAQFDHFEGMDSIDGFVFARELDELGERFKELARDDREFAVRDQIRRWLYFDEDPYSARLARLVERLSGEEREQRVLAARLPQAGGL